MPGIDVRHIFVNQRGLTATELAIDKVLGIPTDLPKRERDVMREMYIEMHPDDLMSIVHEAGPRGKNTLGFTTDETFRLGFIQWALHNYMQGCGFRLLDFGALRKDPYLWVARLSRHDDDDDWIAVGTCVFGIAADAAMLANRPDMIIHKPMPARASKQGH